jgi:hypothetical protein
MKMNNSSVAASIDNQGSVLKVSRKFFDDISHMP